MRRYNPNSPCPVCVTVDKAAPPEELRRVALLQVGPATCCYFPPSHGFVTVVAACKLGEDRKPAYWTALRSWLQLPSDVVKKVVIVDWGSDFDLAAMTTREITALCANASSPGACGGASFDVHKVTPTDVAWKLSAAVNFAVFHGVAGTNSTKYILKVDCDTHLSPRFFDTNDPRKDDDRTFRYADYRAQRDVNDMHLNGVVMATMAAFTAVNGYDERITRYGFDDSLLYRQLQRVAGGKPLNLTRVSATGESLIEHVKHPYTLASPTRHRDNCENHIGVDIAESMQPWKDHVRSSYTEDHRASNEIRAKFGASGGGGAGGVKVNYFVHKVESWVSDVSEVIGAARWTQVEAKAAAQCAAVAAAAAAAAAAVVAAATSP